MQCNRKNCTNNRTHKLEFVLFVNTGDVPAKGLPDVFVCTEHAIKVNPNELLHDIRKKMIEVAFEKAGKAKPDWERSFAKWVQI